MWFANIFFQYAWLSILFNGDFCGAKAFAFDAVQIINYLFKDPALSEVCKHLCIIPDQEDVLHAVLEDSDVLQIEL